MSLCVCVCVCVCVCACVCEYDCLSVCLLADLFLHHDINDSYFIKPSHVLGWVCELQAMYQTVRSENLLVTDQVHTCSFSGQATRVNSSEWEVSADCEN